MAFAVKSSLPVISIGNYTTGNNWGLFTKPGVTIGLDTLKGKKIGSAWRITRVALDEFLKH